jgi:hypothetical protein
MKRESRRNMKSTHLKIEVDAMLQGSARGDGFQQPRRHEVAEAAYGDILAAVPETVSVRPAPRRIANPARTDFETGAGAADFPAGGAA